MSQMYYRPVEGMEILSVDGSGVGAFIQVRTTTGRYTIRPGIMVYLRGKDAIYVGYGPGGWGWSLMVHDLKDDELLINERGMVHTAKSIKEIR